MGGFAGDGSMEGSLNDGTTYESPTTSIRLFSSKRYNTDLQHTNLLINYLLTEFLQIIYIHPGAAIVFTGLGIRYRRISESM